MKKILCLALVVLSLVFVFTGCTGPVRMAEPNMDTQMNERNDRSNVSTSRDGTVNGRNRMGGIMNKNGTINGNMFGNDNTMNPGTR